MDTCPYCHRKLLSHASLKCNWCGATIDDPAYQTEAKQEQAEFNAHDDQRIALERMRTSNMRWQTNWAPSFDPIGFGYLGRPCPPFGSGGLFTAPLSPPDPQLAPLPEPAEAPCTAPNSNEAPPFAAGLGAGLPGQQGFRPAPATATNTEPNDDDPPTRS